MNSSTPHLDHYDAFVSALKDYRIASELSRELQATQLVLMAGPTSVGRDTIIKELVKTGKYYDIITTTTRPPRSNNGVMEQDGVEYHFRPEEYVLQQVRAGRLVGPAIIHEQQVSGMSIEEFQKAQQLQKIAITDLDPPGTIDVVHAKPDTTAIFVLPPSFDEWISRFAKRGKISDRELRNRLESAVKEFKLALASECFVFIVNDQLADAAAQVDAIAHGRHQLQSEQAAHDLARTLCQHTEQYLANS